MSIDPLSMLADNPMQEQLRNQRWFMAVSAAQVLMGAAILIGAMREKKREKGECQR